MPDIDTMRRDARTIFDAALKAADPEECVHRHVRLNGDLLRIGPQTYNLNDFTDILVVGVGKASVSMARALEYLLGNRITTGIINTKYGHAEPLKQVKVNECGHPIPDEAGVRGTAEIIRLVQDADEGTLVLCVISGGGSALSPAPVEGISLAEKQQTTQLLLNCGATINEINTLRKHLSRFKGGQLARIAHPARVVALLLSDVVGDPLSVIASGPTVPDPSTFQDGMAIVEKYELTDTLPQSVREHLQAGAQGEIEETPKPGDPAFARCQNLVIGNNRQAVIATEAQAQQLGYRTLLLSSLMEGETREVAKVHAAIAKEIVASGHPVHRPACVISGGETTVTIRGTGKGGRNQEFVLAGALDIEGMEDVVLFSAGTDGTDGPTDAAGALADGSTVSRAREQGLSAEEFLRNNDSYSFFKRLGDLIITGPTGTNVMDVRLVLVG